MADPGDPNLGWGGMSGMSILALVFGFVLVMNLLNQGRRRRDRFGFGPAEASREELADIERRLGSVEQLESRVLELENRLDFAERLLTSRTGQTTEAQ